MKRRGWLLGVAVAAWGCAGQAPEAFDDAARQAIADTVRAESERMVTVMRTRHIDSVLQFYGRSTAYVGDGQVGDWNAIVASAPARYATYTRVECAWGNPFRVDVLSRTSAVVTATFRCEKTNQAGESWVEDLARTEVLAPEDGRWRIVAVHESTKPGTGALR